MKTTSTLLRLLPIAALLVSVGSPADARTHRHYAKGHSVRAATRSMNRAPGVSKELAPDAKQSATGGQAGGLPGSD